MTLSDLPRWFTTTFVVAFGLIWGSFLNVVIYRVPRGKSVVRPGSACPGCGAPIRAWDNVPVLSYVLLLGKARCCGARLSPRYPLVELIGGVLALAVLEVLVRPLPEGTSLAYSAAVFCASLALALGLVAAAFIDLEHMILPDSITIGGAVLGVATASFRSLTFVDALIGAAVGFVVIWLPFLVIYPRLRGKAGMGLGDAKLLMAAGAWFGWQGALIVLGAGAVQGTLAALAQLALRGKIEEPIEVTKEREAIRAELSQMTPEERAEVEKELAEDPLMEEADEEDVGLARIAFGPFLALGTIEYLLFGQQALRWFLKGGFG